jgi:putative Mg2+ transporter-C (MgtC) family protein
VAIDEAACRLAVSVLFGALVGIERQWHHKAAGIKTHALVTVGAAAFSLISQLGLGPNSNPVQIAAGVVTGIGFIGGGVIMRHTGGVQGINSAATLWATGSLGLAIGGGHYALASTILLAILIAQIPLRSLSSWIDRRSGPVSTACVRRVLIAFQPSADEAVRSVLANFVATCGIELKEHAEKRAGDTEIILEVHINLPAERAGETRLLLKQLSSVPGVLRTEWSRLPPEESE